MDENINIESAEIQEVAEPHAVNLDAAARGDEAKDRVAVDGVAAMGEVKVQALEVLTNDEHIIGDLRVEG